MDTRSRSNEFGIHHRKKTGSWCIQDFASETSRVLTDVLVSWDRAAQLGKVAGASDLHRSSAPIKKPWQLGKRLDCWVPSKAGLLYKATQSIFVYGTRFRAHVFYSEAEAVKKLFIMKTPNM